MSGTGRAAVETADSIETNLPSASYCSTNPRQNGHFTPLSACMGSTRSRANLRGDRSNKTRKRTHLEDVGRTHGFNAMDAHEMLARHQRDRCWALVAPANHAFLIPLFQLPMLGCQVGRLAIAPHGRRVGRCHDILRLAIRSRCKRSDDVLTPPLLDTRGNTAIRSGSFLHMCGGVQGGRGYKSPHCSAPMLFKALRDAAVSCYSPHHCCCCCCCLNKQTNKQTAG